MMLCHKLNADDRLLAPLARARTRGPVLPSSVNDDSVDVVVDDVGSTPGCVDDDDEEDAEEEEEEDAVFDLRGLADTRVEVVVADDGSLVLIKLFPPC